MSDDANASELAEAVEAVAPPSTESPQSESVADPIAAPADLGSVLEPTVVESRLEQMSPLPDALGTDLSAAPQESRHEPFSMVTGDPTVAPSDSEADETSIPSEIGTPKGELGVQETKEGSPNKSSAQSESLRKSSAHESPRAFHGARGREKSAATRARKREAHLEKIITYTHTETSITNDMVEKLLHVSGATATRYLNMLVVRGRLFREGKGRGVRYRITERE